MSEAGKLLTKNDILRALEALADELDLDWDFPPIG
jgi:hypothetical protein